MKCSKTYVAIPPGSTIQEQLEVHEITQKEFVQRMGMSEQEIRGLLNGNVVLTSSIASKLERVLGISSQFWLNLEMLYRKDLQMVLAEKC